MSSDDADFWREYRRQRQAKRAERLPERAAEIRGLRADGFIVEQLTVYQFRVNGAIDLFPVNRRYHVIATNRRGAYRSAGALVRSVLQALPRKTSC